MENFPHPPLEMGQRFLPTNLSLEEASVRPFKAFLVSALQSKGFRGLISNSYMGISEKARVGWFTDSVVGERRDGCMDDLHFWRLSGYSDQKCFL